MLIAAISLRRTCCHADTPDADAFATSTQRQLPAGDYATPPAPLFALLLTPLPCAAERHMRERRHRAARRFDACAPRLRRIRHHTPTTQRDAAALCSARHRHAACFIACRCY